MNPLERTINSLEIAGMVGRDHSKVIRDMRSLIEHLNEAKIGSVNYFIESTYKDAKGEERPCFDCTKKGCELYSTRMTGAKGTQFAVAYIERFNEMENHIKQQPQIPDTPRGLALLALAANEEANQRLDGIDERLVDIEENKLITTEDKGTIDRAVRKKVYQIWQEQHLGQNAKSMLYQDLGSSIKQLFNVPNRGRIKDKDFRKALNFINSWEPSSVTKERINQIQTELEM
ncbi:Rha family transcriptional regulator [Enterococcus mundtii]|uniref:Rha family transcriptional regulator n=1 Tax=Enterococcus mundtii TaxID=53346 RepID=UPI002DB7F143|nr:Rha family transcriptional regulator [Enterococcus mundtii]MEC3942288.1 Rha family transcriptional regulator [Enterococcus mundtii]